MSLHRRWRSISRICRFMGINKKEIERLRDSCGQRISQSLNLSISLLLFCFILTSCTSIPPVIKIGLLAPFEGLQRRSGYVALTAMRQAIADSTPANVAIMPLAVDSGADPAAAERAARKLLQDEAVQAIVGPYTPFLMQSIQPLMTSTGLPWLVPFVVTPTNGFVTPDADSDWALPLLTAATEAATTLGSQRLMIAGWTPVTATAAQTRFALPLVMDTITAIQATDAVFWLGNAKDGAAYFTALRNRFPAVPFLLAPYADDPIFSEQTAISGPVYVLYWQDDGYGQWRTRYPDQPPVAYLTYRATQIAIAQKLGQPTRANPSWRLARVAVSGDSVQ